MIDVVIASEIRIYCEGLEQILSNKTQVNVVGMADNRESAMQACTLCSPLVILIDMTMSDACQLAAQISRHKPKTKIVALAVSYDEGKIMRCAEAGVTCYVPREASIDELIEAIVEAARGECYCPPKISACLLKKLQNLSALTKSKYPTPKTKMSESPTDNNNQRTCLTQRESQIANILTKGLSNKGIARELSIEVSTVKNHVHNILVKLGVSSRSGAVFCLQEESTYRGSKP